MCALRLLPPGLSNLRVVGRGDGLPRGRIQLMRLVSDGEVELDESVVRHIDSCLGCMACVPACPSGVRYDELIEATRAQVERHHRRAVGERFLRAAMFFVFPHSGRLRIAATVAWAFQRLGIAGLFARSDMLRRRAPALSAIGNLLPTIAVRSLWRWPPHSRRSDREAAPQVGLLTGCIQQVFFSSVNEATVRVLNAAGCNVCVPSRQGCCGALMFHSGREKAGLDAARALIDIFEPLQLDVIVVNAAGCGSVLKDYGRLLADDPAYAYRAASLSGRIRDISQFLAEIEPDFSYSRFEVRVAYHDACHLAHAQGIAEEPRRVLRGIPGLELTEVPEGAMCCGSAGIYNVVAPEAAAELGQRKASNVVATGAPIVAAANPGCALQLRRFLPAGVKVLHPMELLDASIRGMSAADPLEGRRDPGPPLNGVRRRQ